MMIVADWPDGWLEVVAVFSVGAYLGALGGALAGLVCGWGAGRYARARAERVAAQDR